MLLIPLTTSILLKTLTVLPSMSKIFIDILSSAGTLKESIVCPLNGFG